MQSPFEFRSPESWQHTSGLRAERQRLTRIGSVRGHYHESGVLPPLSTNQRVAAHVVCAYTMRNVFHATAMLTSTNAPRRRKKATNLSIDHDLLDRARRLKLNLSQAVEAALAAYNEHVEKHGVFSDGLRSF